MSCLSTRSFSFSKPNGGREGSLGGGSAGGRSSNNGSYHLGFLFETPGEKRNTTAASAAQAFDFVCSSSGFERETGGASGSSGQGERVVGFDRVCALRGEVVHIFTFFHPDGVDGDGTGELCVHQEKNDPGRKGSRIF